MPNCPLCALEVDKVVTKKLRRGEGVVMRCDGCDLEFLIGEQSADYYAAQYRQEVSHRASGGATPDETFRAYTGHQKSRLEIVSDSISKDAAVLELGASAGQFLSHINAARRCAIEPDIGYCEFMRSLGLDADNRLLPESRFAQDKFDVVCAFQVMEHTNDPVKFLSEIRAVLKPGGVAFIEVPNLHDPLLSVWDVEEYRPFYYHAQHRFYFSEKSLRKTAELSGMAVEQVRFTQDYNLLNHLHWIMNHAPQPTCEIGLSEISLRGRPHISAWLTECMQELNKEYIDKLVASGETANIMLELRNQTCQ